MQNRSVWFVQGSAGVPRAGEACPERSRRGVAPKRSFFNPRISESPNTREKSAIAGRARQNARRARSPIQFAVILAFLSTACLAQQASPTPSPSEAEVEQVVVTATRFDIPLDQSPASVSVISSDDLRQKQIERVGDALREVPGLSVVQTGTAGQLTLVFLRGLPSQDMQVLLDGIPINQGLAGQFDFANLTTDDIDRIEVVRGPQSTIYGPRA